MTRRVLVAGSGKMARDIGFYCARRGHRVTWASRTRERLTALEEWFARAARRTARIDPAFDAREPRFVWAPGGGLEPADVLIECTVEDAGEKKALLRALEPAITSDTLVVSNSSSIIPREIGPHCMGFHCFYPLEMTRFVEIVVPDDCPAARREALLAFAAGSGLEYLEEDESGAFIANRLLLPIHAECFRLLISGVAPAVVDAATVSTLASVGQLTLMDAIGLDLLHVSAGNYLRRMPEQEVWPYRPLVDGLERLLAVDKRGSRNGDGLLSGAPTPWPITVSEDGQAGLAKRFLYLLVNTCYDALGRNTITDRGLALALDALLAPERTVSQVVETEGRDAIRAALERLYCDTGLPYFRPSGGLTAPVQGSAGAQAPWA